MNSKEKRKKNKIIDCFQCIMQIKTGGKISWEMQHMLRKFYILCSRFKYIFVNIFALK